MSLLLGKKMLTKICFLDCKRRKFVPIFMLHISFLQERNQSCLVWLFSICYHSVVIQHKLRLIFIINHGLWSRLAVRCWVNPKLFLYSEVFLEQGQNDVTSQIRDQNEETEQENLLQDFEIILCEAHTHTAVHPVEIWLNERFFLLTNGKLWFISVVQYCFTFS